MKARERVRVCVVGVGHLGKQHARVYSTEPEAELVAVVDPDRERGEEAAAQYGAAHHFTAEAVVPLVDAASIVTPTPQHLAAARPFLEAGKAVLVEKPLAKTLGEADELIALAERHRALLQVGHIERFNPVIEAALPHIGKPLFIECDRIHPFAFRSTDVSVVLDLMIHDIDLVLYFTDDDLEEVDALGTPVLSTTEDVATARLRFRSGCTAMVKTSRVAIRRSRKIRIFSRHSYLSLDLVAKTGMRLHLREGYDPSALLDASGRISGAGGEAQFLAENVRTELLAVKEQEPLAAELRAFLGAVRSGAPAAVTGLQGRRAMDAAEQVAGCIRRHAERIARLGAAGRAAPLERPGAAR